VFNVRRRHAPAPNYGLSYKPFATNPPVPCSCRAVPLTVRSGVPARSASDHHRLVQGPHAAERRADRSVHAQRRRSHADAGHRLLRPGGNFFQHNLAFVDPDVEPLFGLNPNPILNPGGFVNTGAGRSPRLTRRRWSTSCSRSPTTGCGGRRRPSTIPHCPSERRDGETGRDPGHRHDVEHPGGRGRWPRRPGTTADRHVPEPGSLSTVRERQPAAAPPRAGRPERSHREGKTRAAATRSDRHDCPGRTGPGQSHQVEG